MPADQVVGGVADDGAEEQPDHEADLLHRHQLFGTELRRLTGLDQLARGSWPRSWAT